MIIFKTTEYTNTCKFRSNKYKIEVKNEQFFCKTNC